MSSAGIRIPAAASSDVLVPINVGWESYGTCNCQEDLAMMLILDCLIRGFLGVCRAARNHIAGLLPAAVISRKNAHVFAVDDLVPTVSREL